MLLLSWQASKLDVKVWVTEWLNLQNEGAVTYDCLNWMNYVKAQLEKKISGPFDKKEFNTITVILQEYVYIAVKRFDFFL